ncbi:MAG: DUF167 domain-containing protein [Rhodospirillales bacterium]|nr:DUF167 domain-containing protein [Rhodospirillales bacterium]MCB9964615.1 DUF167 domain-containing protein [Rhodospirillales bacterium]MCB9979904.1 DUF167 domain-containing protein [Rhodospirillales bacterium]
MSSGTKEKILKVRVTPKAAANRIVYDTAADGSSLIRVYVTCVPEQGKANQAVLKLLSKELKVPKSSLKILRGETDRDKIILCTSSGVER